MAGHQRVAAALSSGLFERLRLPPTLVVLYLIVVAVGVFLLREPAYLVPVLALQLLLWALARQPAGDVIRLLRRLQVFFFFILVSFIFFPDSGADPAWVRLPLGPIPWQPWVSLTGLRAGLLMCLRMYTVVFTSMLVRRAIRADEFVSGLRGLLLPMPLALVLDTTLHMLEPEQRRRVQEGKGGGGTGAGRGGAPGGGGGGQGGGGGGGGARGVAVVLRDVLHGDVGFFTDRIEAALQRAGGYVRERHVDLSVERARDLGVVSGVTLTMLSVKWLKILPGLPIAPGHKAVLLLPLYILTAELTHSRWGATLVGSSMGVIGFLMGDGRYGIFEILKHITPGLIVDLLLPLVRLGAGREPHQASRLGSALRYGLVGLIASLGRFATIVGVAFLMGAPQAFYALVAPLALVHLGFGAASGLVSYAIMQSVGRLRAQVDEDDRAQEPSIATSTRTVEEAPHQDRLGGGGRDGGGGGGWRWRRSWW